MFGYLLFLLVLIPFIAFSAWASARVNATYSKYDRVQTRSCMTGYDTATRLMRSRGVSDIAVNRVEGKLTDHYNPSKKSRQSLDEHLRQRFRRGSRRGGA